MLLDVQALARGSRSLEAIHMHIHQWYLGHGLEATWYQLDTDALAEPNMIDELYGEVAESKLLTYKDPVLIKIRSLEFSYNMLLKRYAMEADILSQFAVSAKSLELAGITMNLGDKIVTGYATWTLRGIAPQTYYGYPDSVLEYKLDISQSRERFLMLTPTNDLLLLHG